MDTNLRDSTLPDRSDAEQSVPRREYLSQMHSETIVGTNCYPSTGYVSALPAVPSRVRSKYNRTPSGTKAAEGSKDTCHLSSSAGTSSGQYCALERSFGQDRASTLNLPHDRSASLSESASRPSISSRTSSHSICSILSSLSIRRKTRPTATSRSSFARPSGYNPSEQSTFAAYPWTRPETLERLDKASRTTSHIAISDILLNSELDSFTAAELIQDACQTAGQVGVSTHDLLSRTVFCENLDLGITPLCLEASRVDLGKGGTELVQWLIRNTRPSEVPSEIMKGCLMRLSGMGEQSAWDVLKSFIPTGPCEAQLAYQVDVQGLEDASQGKSWFSWSGRAMAGEDQESAYEDTSTLVGCINQTDTRSMATDKLEEEADMLQVHRAQITIPSFAEHILGLGLADKSSAPNKPSRKSATPSTDDVLTTEWMFEGRLWAFSMEKDTLLLTLRQISSAIPPNPIKVKALVRILPLGIRGAGAKKSGRWIRSLLPTRAARDASPIGPLYECEFEEKELVPGVAGIDGNSSVGKTEKEAYVFEISKLVGPYRGIKVEVMVYNRQ
ncbi:unnamed protein product [Rhizoctonia solani]|nr:unnamed protein product [Rhizoctonia solani]